MIRDRKGRFAKHRVREHVLVPILVGAALIGMYGTFTANAMVEPTPIVVEQYTEWEAQVVLIATTTKAEQLEASIPTILQKIGECESGNNQFRSDGTVVRNAGSSATGRFQIMSSLHRANAESLGLNIDTEEGNIKFALYLYSKNGTRDWEADPASYNCWSQR